MSWVTNASLCGRLACPPPPPRPAPPRPLMAPGRWPFRPDSSQPVSSASHLAATSRTALFHLITSFFQSTGPCPTLPTRPREGPCPLFTARTPRESRARGPGRQPPWEPRASPAGRARSGGPAPAPRVSAAAARGRRRPGERSPRPALTGPQLRIAGAAPPSPGHSRPVPAPATPRATARP